MKKRNVFLKIIGIIAGGLTLGGIAAGLIDNINRKKNPNSRAPRNFYEKYLKRPADFICGSLAVIVFWPIYLVVAVLVRIKLGSPVLFTQDRPGLNEKVFKLYKFRSMTDERDEDGNLLPDEVRLTRFGKILRATSLDELPEAFNIIKGDMSVIGPRPLLVSYLPYYTETEKARHTVRPGLSGLAQVSGRNSLVWDSRLAKDVEYVNNLSLVLDIKIIFMTIKKVFSHSDISIGEEGNLAKIRQAQREKEEQ